MSVRLWSTWTSPMVVLIAVLVCQFRVAESSTMHYVYWNTSSPIFRIDNTDHIIDVNKGNKQFEYDQVNIICPVYPDHSRNQDFMEKYIIYNVSKEEYDTCRITNPSPRVIAVCDKPRRVVYFTITFRSFTPQPGGLEFIPGQDYYFISTSSQDDLHRRIGGRCSSSHMKVIFKICCGPDSQSPNDQPPDDGTLVPKGGVTSASQPETSSPASFTTQRSTTVITVTTANSTYYEVVETRSSSTTKKTDPQPPDPGENEIAPRGEDSEKRSSAPPLHSANFFIIVFIPLLLSLLVPGFGNEVSDLKKVTHTSSQRPRHLSCKR